MPYNAIQHLKKKTFDAGPSPHRQMPAGRRLPMLSGGQAGERRLPQSRSAADLGEVCAGRTGAALVKVRGNPNKAKSRETAFFPAFRFVFDWLNRFFALSFLSAEEQPQHARPHMCSGIGLVLADGDRNHRRNGMNKPRQGIRILQAVTV